MSQILSQLRKPRFLLRNPRHHSLPGIPTLQHRRIPNTRIPQPILHTSIPTPIQNLFRPLHRNGALPRHQLRPPQRLLHNLFLPSPTTPHPTHKPHPLRLLSPKLPRAERNILNPTSAPHDLRQPTQRPYIRRETDIHLFDAKPRIPRTDPHITAHGDIDPQTQTPAMYRRYDRFLALCDAGDTSLERVDVSAQHCCRPCAVESRLRLVGREDGVLGRFLDVEACGEGFGAGAGEDDGAGGGGGGEVGEEGWEFLPHSGDC